MAPTAVLRSRGIVLRCRGDPAAGPRRPPFRRPHSRVRCLGPGVRGPRARSCFVAGYVLATVAFVPGSLLTLAAGAIFGLGQGTAARARRGDARRLGGVSDLPLPRPWCGRAPPRRPPEVSPRSIGPWAGRAGGSSFSFDSARSFPFNLLNYALGLTRVRFADFVVASVGMLPGTLLYVYYGKVIADVARLAGGTPVSQGMGLLRRAGARTGGDDRGGASW